MSRFFTTVPSPHFFNDCPSTTSNAPKFKQFPLETPEPRLPAGLSRQHASARHPIKLTLHPSKIQMNQRQALQIAELNQQIQSLALTKPDTVAFDTQIEQINVEIDLLHQRIEVLQEQIHSKVAAYQDYEEQNQIVLMEMKTQQSKIDELMKRRTQVTFRLQDIVIRKQNHSALFSELKWNADRLEEIDDRIERETLTTSQLRKLLAEKDYIQKGITLLNQSTHSKLDIDAASQSENRLRQELREIIPILHRLFQERDKTREDSGDVYENLKRMRREKQPFISELKRVKVQLDQRYDERAQMIADFKQCQKDFEFNEDQILKLEDQKLAILAEAEITK
jgi:chromosome segregation ATPase